MSRETSSHTQDRSYRLGTHISAPERDFSRQKQHLDDRLRHLSHNILTKHPYLLSIPTDVPYRHSSRFVNTWHLGTPFAGEEEQLQYMSFLPHQEEESDLLMAEGEWADESGNILQEGNSPQDTHFSGANTPTAAQRKKITLHDYKSKAKSGPENSEQLPAMEKSQAQDRQKQVAKINGAQVHDPEEEKLPPSHSTVSGPTLLKKRSREDALESGHHSPHANSKSPRPEKRVRTSLPKQNTSKQNGAEVTSTMPAPAVNHEIPKIPQLLSPTLPNHDGNPDLPQLLSPTLPPAIEGFLAAETTPRSQLDGTIDHYRSEPVRSILATAGLETSLHPKKSPGHKPHVDEQRNHSDSQTSARNALSDASGAAVSLRPGASSHVVRSSAGGGSRPSTPKANGARSSPGPRQRHTIILKYGKKNRKRVEALLKFAPRGKKLSGKPTPAPTGRSDQPRFVSESRTDAMHLPKRPLAETSPVSVEPRHKPPSSAEKPRTPAPSEHKSPLTQSAPQSRSIFSTPKKDLKSSAMRRVESSEGFDARTPSAGQSRYSTPLSAERPPTATKASPPTSAPSSRDEERRAWHSLHLKYFELGRTIKHEGTSIGPSPPKDLPNKDSAMSVVLLIEALLCFMIDMTAVSHSQPAPDPGWRTILPYFLFVFRASRKLPHLHGLVVQLGAVCRQMIHKLDMDRLARDPLPDEQSGSAPTPGSDGNTKINEDIEKYKKRYLDFRNELVSNSKELQVAWLDGSRILSLDTLKQEYPKTWAKRSKDSTLRGTERVTPAKLGVDFFLPLDVSTTPLEATRFAMAFLEEWTNAEDVNWKPRIEL
jgi:hypothetical protein